MNKLVKIEQNIPLKLISENISFLEANIALFSVRYEKKLKTAEDIDRNIIKSLKN